MYFRKAKKKKKTFCLLVFSFKLPAMKTWLSLCLEWSYLKEIWTFHGGTGERTAKTFHCTSPREARLEMCFHLTQMAFWGWFDIFFFFYRMRFWRTGSRLWQDRWLSSWMVEKLTSHEVCNVIMHIKMWKKQTNKYKPTESLKDLKSGFISHCIQWVLERRRAE